MHLRAQAGAEHQAIEHSAGLFQYLLQHRLAASGIGKIAADVGLAQVNTDHAVACGL